MSSLPQKNEAKLMKAGATAYIEKSKMELDQNAESLLGIVKKTLDLSAVLEVEVTAFESISGRDILASLIEEGN